MIDGCDCVLCVNVNPEPDSEDPLDLTQRHIGCGHLIRHACKRCGKCNACRHKYIEGTTGWMKKCPTGKIYKVER